MRLWTPGSIIFGIGAVGGVAMQLNWMANASAFTSFDLSVVLFRLAISAIILPLVFWRIHLWTMKRTGNNLSETRYKRLAIWNACSFAPVLVTLFGFNGLVMTWEFIVGIITAMIGLNLLGHMRFDSELSLLKGRGSLGFLFLISGFAALIYQVAWQRVLFATFGIDM